MPLLWIEGLCMLTPITPMLTKFHRITTISVCQQNLGKVMNFLLLKVSYTVSSPFSFGEFSIWENTTPDYNLQAATQWISQYTTGCAAELIMLCTRFAWTASVIQNYWGICVHVSTHIFILCSLEPISTLMLMQCSNQIVLCSQLNVNTFFFFKESSGLGLRHHYSQTHGS